MRQLIRIYYLFKMSLQQYRIIRFLAILLIVGFTIFFYTNYTNIGGQSIQPMQINRLYNNNKDKILFNEQIKDNHTYIGVIPSTLLINDDQIKQIINVNNKTIDLSSNHYVIKDYNNNNNNNTDNGTIILPEQRKDNYLDEQMQSQRIQDDVAIVVVHEQSQLIGEQQIDVEPQQQQPQELSTKILKLSIEQQGANLSFTVNSNNNNNNTLTPQSQQSQIQVLPQLEQQQVQPLSSNIIIINSNNVTTSAIGLDTTRGIRTGDIYESGHIETMSNICPNMGSDIKLLILITSAPNHYESRLAIRQTWGHYGHRRDISIAFILGVTLDEKVERELIKENYLYEDLIRGYFVDSYNNLTLKTISLLEWVDSNCPQADYILKTDDDMFINVPKLQQFIEKHQKDKRVIYGRLAKKWKPIRNKKSKYYVSPQQYFPAVFPQFTTGPAYLMSSDVVHDLYNKSLNQTYLKLEDVYTTGIVAQLVNVKRIHVNEFLNRRIQFNPCNIKKAISVHMIKGHEQFDLWKKLQDNNTKCK